ncbi:MAG: protein YgfX [Thiobacillus sp.]
MREIELKPSRLLRLLLLGMTALALFAIYLAAVPGALQWTLAAAVTGVSGWSWHRANVGATLRIAVDGRLQSRDDTAEWREVEVLGDSFVSMFLIVLRVRGMEGRVRTLTLLPDSAEVDALRRLRVSLRWARHTRSDTGSRDAD